MSTKPAIITDAEASGEELATIVSKIEPILLNFPADHCVIALLCLASTMMNPYISADELQDVVLQTSQFLCLALDGKGEMQVVGGSEGKAVMN